MGFAIGENVGPYRVLEQLGQGGMASVFKAYHAALDRYVAMKVLHPAFKEEPNFIARFEREAKVVARLEHPHIVPIYDFAEHNDQPYLVMKYIEGETLKARLTERPLTKHEAIEIADSVGGALAYAHEQGVLHRDIKPSNVLLCTDGSIYLADFGLARIAQAGASTLSKDVMMGTPQYISPEQAQGVRELDEGTDIYSMGVVLYEMVVGRVPFNADTPFSIIHDHIYTALPLPTKVNPRVPKNVERLLLKALSKDRESRFESVEQLIQAFRVAVLDGEGAVIPGMDADETKVAGQEFYPHAAEGREGISPSVGGSLVKTRPRRRWPWVLAGIALTLLCLVALSIIAGNREIDPVESLQDQAPTGKVLDQPPADQALDALPSLEGVRDPQVHFERAKRLEEIDRPILASQSYFKAGELFLEGKRYPEAVESLLKYIELGGVVTGRSERAESFFVEAFFMAAAETPLYEQIERLERLVPDRAELPIFIARTELHYGQLKAAREIITQVVDDNPDHMLARAVLAEIHLEIGEIEKAQRIVEMGLENARALPPWLQDHFNWLQSQIEA